MLLEVFLQGFFSRFAVSLYAACINQKFCAAYLQFIEVLHHHCHVFGIELSAEFDQAALHILGYLFDPLLEAGALDVFTTPVLMKKQRQGILLTVLCVPSDREKMLDLIFRESTTFGIREHVTKRFILERSFQTLETPYGEVRIKIGKRHGETVTASPEIEDCRKCAAEHGVAVQHVYNAALSVFNSKK